MTKGQLDGIRDYWLSLTMPAYSIHQDTVLDGREILSSAQQDIRTLIEALEQAWADGKAAFDLSQECRRRAVEAECERDALITKLAEAEEQVEALEMGYRGFP